MELNQLDIYVTISPSIHILSFVWLSAGRGGKSIVSAVHI